MVNALLRHCPSHTLKHMSSLLPAIIQKLSEAKSSPLIVSLLSVCCELVLVDPNQLVDYLSQTQNPGSICSCQYFDLFTVPPCTKNLHPKTAKGDILSCSSCQILALTICIWI